MRTLILLAITILLSTALNWVPPRNSATGEKETELLPGQSVPSKKLVMEILETYWGVGGTSHLVFLRIFSDRTIQSQPRRLEDEKKSTLNNGEISQAQLSSILALIAEEDVKKLPSTFRSTYTPIDSSWTLDIRIPRGTDVQQIKVVNFYPEMAKQNDKPYPEALMRLTCSVFALRLSLTAEKPYYEGECREYVTSDQRVGQ
jgi:hypothetical protein